MPFLFRRGRTSPSLIRFLAFLWITMAMASTKMGINRALMLGSATTAMRRHFGFFSFLLPLSTSSAFAWVPLRDYGNFPTRRTQPHQKSVHLHPRQTLHSYFFKTSQPTFPVSHRLYSTTDTNDIEPQIQSEGEATAPNERAKLLNECLNAVLKYSAQEPSTTTDTKTPADQLMEAALESLRNPSGGYDPKYGRPALRAYRSFVYPKQSNDNHQMDNLQLEAMAKRTANQIDFLVKRQTSRMNQAVRNHDDPNNAQATDSETQQALAKFPITLVLDNLRGSFNVGSIFRTAEVRQRGMCLWILLFMIWQFLILTNDFARLVYRSFTVPIPFQ